MSQNSASQETWKTIYCGQNGVIAALVVDGKTTQRHAFFPYPPRSNSPIASRRPKELISEEELPF